MTQKRFQHLIDSVGILRHSCDLDVVLFFHRHPRALLTSERLAAYVGYDLNQVARSLDVLTDAGVLERSQNPTHPARMYMLKTPQVGWLTSLLEIASRRGGRRDLMQALREAKAPVQSARDPDEGHDSVPTRRLTKMFNG